VTFTPASPFLAPHTLYTATINGVTDLVGNAMLSPYVWNFEAIVAAPSVVSTTPATGAIGVAYNPAPTISATFLQLPATDPDYADAALVCPTASTFTVAVSGTGGAAVTPTSVTCSGATATFNLGAPLLAGISYTATLSTGIKNVAGIGLASTNCSAPCAYQWAFTTNVLPPTVISTSPVNLYGIEGINQTLTATFFDGTNGSMNASTIISPATNFTLVNETTGVPVTGNVTLNGLIATFTPTSPTAPTTPTPLANNTSYEATITTGVKDSLGNALANNYVWVFTTAVAPDTTHPTVIAENPVDGATGVPNNQIVTAYFSKAMNSTTIATTPPHVPPTFTLTGPAPATTVVAGTVGYSSIANAVSFTLQTGTTLAAGGVYTATITDVATDTANPPNDLIYTAGTDDLPLSWSFTVGTTAPVGPYITLTSPVDLAASVPLNQAVSATFNTAMDFSTFSPSTFTLTNTATGVQVTGGTYSYTAGDPTATPPVLPVATYIPPVGSLLPDTTYQADIAPTVTDASTPGNPLVSNNVSAPNPWVFTTAGVAPPPAVVLGTAAQFGDFGGNFTITNQGPNTAINNGSIGTTAASSLVTGFHDTSVGTAPASGGVWPCTYTEAGTPGPNIGQVNSGSGNIGIFTANGSSNTTACPLEGTAYTFGIAQAAAAYAQAAYTSISPAAMPGGIAVEGCAAPQCIVTGGSPGAGELGGRTLQAGVYQSTPGSYAITSLPLVLDAQGNPNATWVFQMGSSLTVGGPGGGSAQDVTVINGSVANCANVFWQVSSAAVIDYNIGVGTPGATFCGTVIANLGVTTGDAGVYNESTITINGRLLSLNAAVTLVNTVINVPAH
jgi:hypothetical protein